MKKLILGFYTLSLLVACSAKKADKAEKEEIKGESIPYDLNKPVQKYLLPRALDEISGLSFYKKNQLACINDEEGTLFIYDFIKKEIIKKVDFGKSGDYEGVEVVGDEIFVLKSNGKIHSFKIEEPFERDLDCSHKDVKEYEGLSYDSKKNYLLLAAKQRSKDKDDVKMIYAYNLNNQSLFKYIGIPESQVKTDKGGKEFRPSGIAIDPLTGDTYIIASQGKKLLVLAADGHKKVIIDLDPSLYTQPEGICFTPQGELFISSEGSGKSGYILQFSPKSVK